MNFGVHSTAVLYPKSAGLVGVYIDVFFIPHQIHDLIHDKRTACHVLRGCFHFMPPRPADLALPSQQG